MTRGTIARNVARGAFWISVEKVVSIASTILYTALIARWLGPTKYGLFKTAFAIIGVATVLTGNFETFLERYAAEYQVQGRFTRLARAHRIALAFKLVLGALTSAIVLLVTPTLARHYEMPSLLVLLPALSLFIATDGLATTGRAMLFGLQRFKWVSGVSLIFNLGRTLLVGALWHLRQGLPELAVGLAAINTVQAVVMTVAAFVALRVARREWRDPEPPAPESEPGLLRGMFGYCLPLYGAKAAFLSGQNLSTLVLAKLLDTTALGYFTFAFQTVERIVELLYALPSALLPSLTQLVARDERDRLQDIFGQAFRLIQVAAVVTSFGMIVFAPELVVLVGSPLFQPAIPYLRVLALVPVVRTAQQPLTMLFQAMRRPGHVLWLAVLKVCTEASGYVFVLLLPLGAMGASGANLAGAVVSFIGAMVFGRAALPEGAGERLAASLRSLLWLTPALLASLLAEQRLGLHASLPVRVAFIIPAVVGLFALRLVIRYDLVKLSSVPLPHASLDRVRGACVAVADRLALVFEPRSDS